MTFTDRLGASAVVWLIVSAAAATLFVMALASVVCPNRAWADDAVCGYAYLDKNQEEPGMYTLVIQKTRRENGRGYRYLGPVNNVERNYSSTPWYASGSVNEIREVVVRGGVSPEDIDEWFIGDNLRKVDLSGLDASRLTRMSGLFGAYSRSGGHAPTVEYVNCSGLNASNVDAYHMFEGCTALKSVDLSYADFSKVGYFSDWFSDCTSLEHVDLTGMKTSGAQSMDRMFSGCSSLESIDLSTLDFSNVDDMLRMFEGCASLKTVAFPSVVDASKLSNIAMMFADCKSLESLDLSCFKNANFNEFGHLVKGCGSLKYLNLSGLKVAEDRELKGLLSSTVSLETLNLSGFSAPKETTLSGLCSGCESLKTADFSNFNAPLVEDLSSLFSGCEMLESVDLTGFKVASSLDGRMMFKGCKSLNTVDVSWLGGKTIANASLMFDGCRSLVSVGFPKTQQVKSEYIYNTFQGCSSLERLDLSALVGGRDVANDRAFRLCSCLQELTIGPGFTSESAFRSLFESYTTWIPDYDESAACSDSWAMRDIAKERKVTFRPGARKTSRVFAYEQMPSHTLVICPEERVMAAGERAFGFVLDSRLPWQPFCDTFKKVRIEPGVKPESASVAGWFSGFSEVTEFEGLENLDLSSVTSIEDMFSGCESLTSLNLSSMRLPSACQMPGLLKNCTSLERVVFPIAASTKLTGGRGMFSGCQSLAQADLGGFNLSALGDASEMFYGCSSLRTIDLGGNAVVCVSSLCKAFEGCSSLETVDFSRFKPLGSYYYYIDFSSAFNGCSSLRRIDLLGFKGSSPVRLAATFKGCSSLEALDLSRLTIRYASDMSGVFDGCSSLASVKFEGTDIKDGVHNAARMFAACGALESLDISGFDFSEISDAAEMFAGCSSLETIKFPTGASSENLYMSGAFDGCSSLKAIDTAWFKGARSIDMALAFRGCSSLVSLDLSGVDASGTENLQELFKDCASLGDVSLDGFIAKEGVQLDYMFSGCSALKQNPFNQKIAPRARSASHMFQGCSSIKSFFLSSIDCAYVDDASYMFSGCTSLAAVDLSVDVWSGGLMEGMFENCTSLKEIDFSRLKRPIQANVSSILVGCDALSRVKTAYSHYATTLPEGMWRAADGSGVYAYNSIPAGAPAEYVRIEGEQPHLFAVLKPDGKLEISGKSTALGEGEVRYALSATGYPSADRVPWHGRAAEITSVSIISNNYNTWHKLYAAHWFEDCTNLKSFECGYDLFMSIDHLFTNCTSLENVVMENATTSSVTDFSEMFLGCTSLVSVDLTGAFDTRRATSMRRMFHDCPSLSKVKLGDYFTFRGAEWSRLPGSELPIGAWEPSVQPGSEARIAYASDSLPDFEAETYTRVDEAPGLTVVSLRGDTVDGKTKYEVETEFVVAGDGGIEQVDSYILDDRYALDTFTVGESAKASSVKTLSSPTVTRKTVASVVSGPNSRVTAVTLGTQVAKVSAQAFASSPTVNLVTVKSHKLTKRSSMANCLSGSKVTRVVISVSSDNARKKVADAFRAWSGRRAK